MYRVWVVDDFVLDRRMITQMIQGFGDLPLEVVGESENGVEALELVRDLAPDILICDVEMPLMSGLDLANTLRERSSDVRIIFCSLYDKLHYLKAAIQVRSDGYITKPFSADELYACVKSVLLQLMDIKKQAAEMDALKRMMDENHGQLLRYFYSDLLYGYVMGRQALSSKCGLLGINEDAAFRIAVIEIDDYYAGLYTPPLPEESSVVSYRVMRSLEAAAIGPAQYDIVRLSDTQFVLVFRFKAEECDTDALCAVEETLDRLIHDLRRMTIGVTATFSERITDLLQMKRQCELCQYRLQFKWVLGKGQVIFAGEVPGQMPQQEINVGEIIRQVRFLLNDTQEDIETAGEHMIGQMLDALAPLQQLILCQYLMTCVQIVLQENGASIEKILDNHPMVCAYLPEKMSVAERRLFIQALFRRAHAFLHSRSKDNRFAFIQEVQNYIEKSDLSKVHLELVANRFSYSPNYLNHLFKEETGLTILDYITRCRMQKAKQMLSDPCARLSDIAEALGYSHATYFSMVFKKNEGITPKKYTESGK